MNYNLKQSDEKQQFSTGAQRDDAQGKPRLELISPIFLDRLGILLAKGADHYGERNWEKGMPLSRLLSSALRHLNQLLDGQEDEDHAIQCTFNLMAYVHTLHRIRLGSLPAELDDLPRELILTNKEDTVSPTNIVMNCGVCNYDQDVPMKMVLEAARMEGAEAPNCRQCGAERTFRKKNLKADLTSNKKLPTIRKDAEAMCCRQVYHLSCGLNSCSRCGEELYYA